jgi:hypothetical protein
MKIIVCLLVCLISAAASGQTETEKLEKTLREFHQALVHKNTVSLNQQTDKALSYGHSNGWVEQKGEMLKNIASRYIDYEEFKEDSLSISINGNMAHARFVADIKVTLNGKKSQFRLKVLEVWVKKGKRWLLFARQAIKG